MRIAVCDDEEVFSTQEKELIDKLAGSIDVIVDAYSDGRKLLEAFDKNPYDVLFLDIEMPAMDGITLAKKLRERSDSIYIVFLTGHVEYALEGYEVMPSDILLSLFRRTSFVRFLDSLWIRVLVRDRL